MAAGSGDQYFLFFSDIEVPWGPTMAPLALSQVKSRTYAGNLLTDRLPAL